VAQEERLYRDYFAARADQADKAMQFARTAAAMNPDDTVKKAEALLAEQTAMRARAELDAQNARAHAVKERIKVVRSNRRSRRQAKASVPPSRPTPVPVRQTAVPKPKLAPVPPTPVPIHKAPPIQAAPVEPPVLTAIAVPKPKPPSITAKPAAPMEARTEPKRPAVAPMPVPVILRAAPAPPPTKVASEKPKAPVALVSHKPAALPTRAPVVPTPPAAVTVVVAPPTLAPKPTPAFRSSQATKAAQIARPSSAPAKLECPNCSAKVAANAKRCRCGFEMPLSASQIPSLSMSPEDRAALLAALAPLGNANES